MERTKHARVKTIFAQAAELRTAERERFLHKMCGADRELHQEVDSLFEHHFAASIVEDRDAYPSGASQGGIGRANLPSAFRGVRTHRLPQRGSRDCGGVVGLRMVDARPRRIGSTSS